jgi:RNA polymerase sigma-70 factor (ECF subfamily)
MMLSEPDEILVQRSRNGDRAAFEALVHRTARLVFSRVFLETGNVHRAEDLTQETFLTAWRSISQVDRPEGFRTWLLSIARTVVIDSARKQLRKKRSGKAAGDEDVLLRIPSADPSPPRQLEDQEKQQRALSLLRSLPEDYRLPLTLRYLGGLDYQAIEKQLGMSNGSLRGLLGRGLAMLREQMGEDAR